MEDKYKYAWAFNLFDPKEHKHVYFCNNCYAVFFSNSMFEDLCPNNHCESEHIYSEPVTDFYLTWYEATNQMIEEHRAALIRLKEFNENFGKELLQAEKRKQKEREND